MAKLGPLALAAIAAAFCRMGESRRFAAGRRPFLRRRPPRRNSAAGICAATSGVGVNAAAPELKITPDPIGRRRGRVHFRRRDAVCSATRRCRRSAWSTSAPAIRSTSWFRADATIEYRAGARLQSLYAADRLGWRPGAICRDRLSRRRRLVRRPRQRLLSNLGTWYGLSPFLGAGVGFADNRLLERQREPPRGGAEASPRARD